MKNSIMLVLGLLLTTAVYALFLKVVIVRLYKKYMFNVKSISAAVYAIFLAIGFIVMLFVSLEPLQNTYYILTKQGLSSVGLIKEFLPLLGQHILLVIVLYAVILFLSNLGFKFSFRRDGVIPAITESNLGSVLLFGLWFLPLAVFASYFVLQIAQLLVPLSGSIT